VRDTTSKRLAEVCLAAHRLLCDAFDFLLDASGARKRHYSLSVD